MLCLQHNCFGVTVQLIIIGQIFDTKKTKMSRFFAHFFRQKIVMFTYKKSKIGHFVGHFSSKNRWVTVQLITISQIFFTKKIKNYRFFGQVFRQKVVKKSINWCKSLINFLLKKDQNLSFFSTFFSALSFLVLYLVIFVIF